MANGEIAAIRQMIAQFPRALSVEETRQAYDGASAYFPKATDVKLEPQTIGAALAEWSSTPGTDNSRTILFLHGGGYVAGSLVSHRHLAIELGRAAGTRTLALDYRLAPEAPFPAALDDAMSGYRFFVGSGAQVLVHRDRRRQLRWRTNRRSLAGCARRWPPATRLWLLDVPLD